MRTLQLITILIFITDHAFSQTELEKLDKEELILNNSKAALLDSISKIQIELERIKNNKELIAYNASKNSLPKKYYSKVTGLPSYIMTEPTFGERINLKKGEIVELIDIIDKKAKVFVKSTFGYAWLSDLEQNSDLVEFKKAIESRNKFEPEKNNTTTPDLNISSDTTRKPDNEHIKESLSQTSYQSPSNSYHSIQTGPKGGKYYINKNGNKTYVKKKR
jgi:hypothetical protein